MQCPKCKEELDSTSPDGEHWRWETVEQWKVRNPGGRLRCIHCRATIVGGKSGSNRSRFRGAFEDLKRTYEPRDQFTTFTNGQRHTHYGVTKRLEASGYSLPAEFKGNSDQLAKRIGIDHAELTRMWMGNEQDMRQLGLITITHPPKK